LYEKLEPIAPTAMRIVDQYGGEILSADLWNLVAGMHEEKKIIDGRVVAPLADPSTAERVGVKAPATVLLFGPPGTGKTTFAKAIAGRLGWPFIELLPSKLESGNDSMSSELRQAMNDLLQLERAVVFIDEFDEIASARERNPTTKGVVNELLKMIPFFRSTPGHLLVCATNFVGDIDSAVLRPGRFDLVIPIGPPDLAARLALWTAALSGLDHRGVDIEKLALDTEGYTPGDVELAAQRAATAAFDRLREGAEPTYVSADDFDVAIARTRASVSNDIRQRFSEEAERFARV
jgi:SpoVK/Ycf46/Vps4 family AAA+-type ATPase